MTVSDLFALDTSPLELVLRGTLIYWALLLTFRFVLRRDLGSLNVSDVLFIVIVADASQNGMSGGYDTVSEAMVLIGTLAGWNYLLDVASYRSALVRTLLQAPPLILIRDGKVIARNLRREFLTLDDLHSQLREAGIASIADVREAYLESDGKFSVIERKPGGRERQVPGKDGPAGGSAG
ncbi:MAG TPA: YetF domain-containing protein [Ramlibacter sp.]|uniref:DUF421 domain-containing protein n=1 Tax=Ramlibacter sp. TaxID=1917967 RepID=UPI002C0D890C|nr:YetF domain-containing protein [Ramlibacter sp.]HVZ46648.1 YetF domain-containing protein [Ramlibacter sp.]